MSGIAKGVQELSRSAGIIFIGTVIGQGLGLLGEVFIAKSLSPERYGNLSLAYTIILLGGTITLFGVHNGVTRLMTAFKKPLQRRRVLYHGHLLILLLSIIAILGFTVGREFLGNLMNEPELPGLLLLFFPLLIVNPTYYLTYGALRAESRPGAAIVAKDITGRTLPLTFLVIAVFLSRESLGAIVYWIGFPVVTLAVSIYYLRDKYRYSEIIEEVPDQGIIRRLWSFSWPLAASSFIFIFLSYLDIIMIGYFLQSKSVGYYRSIQPLREASTFALGAFSFIFLPMATEYFESGAIVELEKLYSASTKWIMMGTFPLVIVLGLFSDDIVRVAIGSEYLPAAPVLTILVFGLFFRAVVGMNGEIVQAINQTRIELVSAAIGLMTNFLLNVVLIPRFGIQGAAVATVVGYIVYNSAEIIGIFWTTGIHPFSVNNLKPLVPPLLVGVIIAHVLSSHPVGPLSLALIGFIIGSVQLLSPFITGSITQEDVYLIREIEKVTGIQFPWIE